MSTCGHVFSVFNLIAIYASMKINHLIALRLTQIHDSGTLGRLPG